MEEVRSYNVGTSDYSSHTIQPWDIWLEYKLNPFDADIVKRILRKKAESGMSLVESRILDYKKIIHIANERIRQLESNVDAWNELSSSEQVKCKATVVAAKDVVVENTSKPFKFVRNLGGLLISLNTLKHFATQDEFVAYVKELAIARRYKEAFGDNLTLRVSYSGYNDEEGWNDDVFDVIVCVNGVQLINIGFCNNVFHQSMDLYEDYQLKV
jgi:hypothetical protein